MSERQDFFAPVWRRVAIVGACAGWAGLELYSGETYWAGIAAAVTVYGVWSFFLNYPAKPRA